MNHTKLCGQAQFTAHGQAYSGSSSSLQWLLLAGTATFFFLWWWVEIWKYVTYMCSLQRCYAYNTKWGIQYVSNFSSFTVLLNLYLSQDFYLLLCFNTEHYVICCSDNLPLLMLNKISINHSYQYTLCIVMMEVKIWVCRQSFVACWTKCVRTFRIEQPRNVLLHFVIKAMVIWKRGWGGIHS